MLNATQKWQSQQNCCLWSELLCCWHLWPNPALQLLLPQTNRRLSTGPSGRDQRGWGSARVSNTRCAPAPRLITATLPIPCFPSSCYSTSISPSQKHIQHANKMKKWNCPPRKHWCLHRSHLRPVRWDEHIAALKCTPSYYTITYPTEPFLFIQRFICLVNCSSSDKLFCTVCVKIVLTVSTVTELQAKTMKYHEIHRKV